MLGDPKKTVKSADRALDIVELLSHSRQELSHADIGDRLAIPKSSLTPLLRNLVERKYLELSLSNRTYRLGAAFLNLSNLAKLGVDLAEQVGPFLNEITRETGETSALNEQRGDTVETVASVTAPSILVTMLRPGDRAPLYATSGGKAILAFLPAADCKAYISSVQFVPFTSRTIKSRSKLTAELNAIRKTGFGYSLEEHTTGVVGIAVPLLDKEGFTLASLNVAIPAARYNEEKAELARLILKRTAQAFCQHILFPGRR